MNPGHQLENKFPISEATRKRNPHLFNLGAVEADRPKRAPLQTLVTGVQEPASRTGRVDICITLVQFRKRLLDGHDNLAYAVKPLADAIAASLGIDDADKRLHWKHEQVQTTGQEGVLVKFDAKQLLEKGE